MHVKFLFLYHSYTWAFFSLYLVGVPQNKSCSSERQVLTDKDEPQVQKNAVAAKPRRSVYMRQVKLGCFNVLQCLVLFTNPCVLMLMLFVKLWIIISILILTLFVNLYLTHLFVWFQIRIRKWQIKHFDVFVRKCKMIELYM